MFFFSWLCSSLSSSLIFLKFAKYSPTSWCWHLLSPLSGRLPPQRASLLPPLALKYLIWCHPHNDVFSNHSIDKFSASGTGRLSAPLIPTPWCLPSCLVPSPCIGRDLWFASNTPKMGMMTRYHCHNMLHHIKLSLAGQLILESLCITDFEEVSCHESFDTQ